MSDLLPFSGHNVDLPGGQTKPGYPVTPSNGVARAALRLARLVCPDGGRVADLGCLEGGYAVGFARAGFDVLGIEARARNLERCQYVADQALVPNLEFVQDDVRNLAAYGDFDIVFCAGLLYHLDNPAAFLKMVGALTCGAVIIQSHFSQRPDAEHEGRAGHWYNDNPSDSDLWGSHGNPRSFWLAEPDLLAAIGDAGFGLVFRQFDYLADIASGPPPLPTPSHPEGGHDRGMFVGVKC